MENRFERRIKGYRSYVKGIEFERKIANWLSNQGYSIKKLRQRSKKFGEVDIIAIKYGLFGRVKEVLFVECKDKDKVSLKDFHRFVRKFSKFLEREPKASGIFIYRGELEKDVKDYYENTLDVELHDLIKIKKWRG
ncbi:MAG: YraN family protein [Nitrososphaerota archaeon]